MFTLAYLTDPHLAPIPRPSPLELMSKRITGYLNWLWNRRFVYDRETLDAITQDLRQQDYDHIAVGGDLINLSLPDEFGKALDWLQTLGSPENVSITIGNHDAYVPYNYESGLGLWDAYMMTDVRKEKSLAPVQGNFPYVRRFGDVALIGVRSGIPTGWFLADGEVGQKQRQALERILEELRKQSFFRIVMVHHPPIGRLTRPKRGLRDVDEFEELLTKHGPELVLFGHEHKQIVDMLETEAGETAIVCNPSPSISQGIVNDLARYNLFRIWKSGRKWNCEMTGRGLTGVGGPIGELEKVMLTG